MDLNRPFRIEFEISSLCNARCSGCMRTMLDDRGDREPVLLNRKLMRQMNVMVNPQRKYVVTTKFSVEEK